MFGSVTDFLVEDILIRTGHCDEDHGFEIWSEQAACRAFGMGRQPGCISGGLTVYNMPCYGISQFGDVPRGTSPEDSLF